MAKRTDSPTNPKIDQDDLPVHLVGGFLQRRAAEVLVLREAFEKDDFDSVKSIGHRLKGNGTSFGFPSLSQLGSELEICAVARDQVKGLLLVDDLEKMVWRFQDDIHSQDR